MTSKERAKGIVEAYARGVICGGEVLNQFVDHISDNEVEVETYMGALSTELILRFEQDLRHERDYPLARPEDLTKIRHGETLIRAWLRHHNPEPGAAPNGGPEASAAKSGITNGPPSVT